MNAYVFSDRGTWISFKNKGDLEIVVEGDQRLFNQYGVMLVNPEKHPAVKKDLGQTFIDWVVSAEGQEAIRSYKIEGQQLFFPNAAKTGCSASTCGAAATAHEMPAMRAFVALAFLLAASVAYARTVPYFAGRKVDVPDKIERVFAAGPPASILLYMLAPEKMTGWPNPPTAEERPFIAAPYRDLPALGRRLQDEAARPTSRLYSNRSPT